MAFNLRAIPSLVLIFALTSSGVFAHSTKEETEPADSAVLTIPPDAIGMQFDMPMRVTLISLTDADGRDYALTRSDDMQPVSEFSAVPPDLPSGRYTVEWRGLAEDGHPMQGAFSFEIKE